MNKPLVRKFQPPGSVDASAAPQPSAVSHSAVPAHEPESHFDIPEINTDFIDNLWQDPSFVDRFDAGFDKTVPMGLDGAEVPLSQRSTEHEPKNLLDFDFQGPADKKNA